MLIPNKEVQLNDTKEAVIANSMAASAYTMSIGDCIQPAATGHTKYVVGAATSGLILGVVVGIKFKGKVMEVNAVTGVNTASTAAGASQMNLHNDNETTGYWSVTYIPAYIPMEYAADLNQTQQTTDSDGFVTFPLIGVATVGGAGTLNEAAPGLFGASAQQFVSYGLKFGSTTKVVGHLQAQF